MDLNEAKDKLANAGLEITAEARMKDGRGTRLDLKGGAVVNVFDTGTCSVQGRNTDTAKAVLGLEGSPLSVPIPPAPARSNGKVFVVYGHDPTARNQLEVMLRRWGLEPLILDQLPSEGQTIIEKLEKYTSEVQFAVVLSTPDDEGHRADHPDEKAYRARQNVVLELGMLLATLGRSKVAILLKDQAKMERPSDIHGLIYIPFKDNLQVEVGPSLAREMATQGYSIDVKRL